jgi:hypothetical protein
MVGGLERDQPTRLGGHLPPQALKPDLQTLLYTTVERPFIVSMMSKTGVVD